MPYSISDFRRDIRAPYAWPGGYPRYFITADGEALSFAAAKERRREILESIRDRDNDQWRVVACDVNWEDSGLTCAHTGAPIESAYGEAEAESGRFAIVVNMPGYMPDAEPYTVATLEEAREALANEIRQTADTADDGALTAEAEAEALAQAATAPADSTVYFGGYAHCILIAEA